MTYKPMAGLIAQIASHSRIGLGWPIKIAESPMAVQIICPNLKCRKILSVPEELRGKQVKCQNCQTVLRVPDSQKQTAKLAG
jgi:LSD1 subclass zinc finger protein